MISKKNLSGLAIDFLEGLIENRPDMDEKALRVELDYWSRHLPPGLGVCSIDALMMIERRVDIFFRGFRAGRAGR